LPPGATFQEKQSTAKAAVHKINAEFEHSRTCDRFAGQVTLWSGTDEERRRAKLAVEKTLKALPVSSSPMELEEAKNTALKPFEEAIEKKRKEKEKQERIEERIDDSLNYIKIYLEELDSLDDLDSDGACSLTILARDLREAITPELRRELGRRELTDAQFKRLIERMVDERLEI